LFVDVSGFTPLATALTEYSTEGAEVIAAALGTIFEPLIEIIYRMGGFVASFAGDAFTALFPTDPLVELGPCQASYGRALLAAWQSSNLVAAQATQPTRFGKFPFAIKISIADGMVDWGIWQSAGGPETVGWRQRAAYFFIGEAIERCFAADRVTPAGGIVLTAAVYRRLPAAAVTVRPLAGYQQLMGLTAALLGIAPLPPVSRSPDSLGSPAAAHFFPMDLLQQAPPGEFRQVVAMFINLSAPPTGEAGEQFQAAFFHYLAQYGGHLCSIGRITHQDHAFTLLLFWGAPTSYENNVARALRFVLDLRRSAPVPLRVGITYHLAYAGFIGAPQRMEYTCYGLHIALAARQMISARYGEIILDGQTASQAYKDFQLRAHGLRKFKGVLDERPIYLLDRRRAHLEDADERLPFVDRQHELAMLHRHLGPLHQGQFGGVVLITGEAGLGKSRLLREFRRTLVPKAPAESTATPAPAWFYCRTDELLRLSLNPFRYLLYRYFNQSETQELAQNRQRFMEKMEELLAATTDAPLKLELVRLRAVLAALIGLPWETTFYQQLDPALRLENALGALKTLFKAESRRQPLIIQLEDAQWLDRESTRFLEKLLHNIADYPLLLLITMRTAATAEPTEHATANAVFTAVGPCTHLSLAPFSAENLALLVTQWLDGAVAPTLLARLQQQAQGNPFFAESILLYWQEHECLQWDDGGWQLEIEDSAPYQTQPLLLSPDVRTILTARLDRLPVAVKLVVQTAAVLGEEFHLPVLTHLLEQEQLSTAAIGLAEAAGIWRIVAGTSCRFHHALLCEVAYAMQSHAQLEKLHRAAATAIQTLYQSDLQPYYAALVYHYYKAHEPAQELHYARLAGASATVDYLNRDALRYFDRALALTRPDALAERYGIVVAREALYRWLGDRQAQWQDILLQLTLATAANHQPWQVEAHLRKADYERTTGQYEAALATLHAAALLATPLADAALSAQLGYLEGQVLRQQGEHEAAHQQLMAGLQAAQRAQAPLLIANCLHEIGHLYYVQGDYSAAGDYYSQAEALYQQTDDKRGQINCLLMFGAIAYGKGRFGEAEQRYEKALAIAQGVGWLPGEASCLSNLGNTYFDVGDYTRAHASHWQALHLFQEIGDREGEAVSLDTLGLITQRQGDYQGAQHYLTSALAIQQELGDQHGEAYTQTHLGYLLLEQSELAAAKVCFHDALQIRQRLGELGAAVDSLAGLAYSQWQAGERTAAFTAAQSIIHELAQSGTDGLEFPVQIYLICYQILQDLASQDAQYQITAQRALANAYTLVQTRLSQITDEAVQRLFLTAVPVNATVIALWNQQIGQHNPLTA